MPFIYKKSGQAHGGRVLMQFTLANSGTYTIGDAVRLVSGKLTLAALGNVVAGIVAGFQKADGSPVTDNGASAAFTDTYYTSASNTVKAVIDISRDSIYSVTADDTLGTTTGSNLAGYTMDCLAASDQLDESSALTTTGQFMSLGQDPDPSAATNSVLVMICESQLPL